MDRFVPPAFMGFAGQISGLRLRDQYRAHDASVTLLARRSTHRAGTRQWRRGADLEAAVSNYAESEQLVVVDGGVVLASFVQVPLAAVLLVAAGGCGGVVASCCCCCCCSDHGQRVLALS